VDTIRKASERIEQLTRAPALAPAAAAGARWDAGQALDLIHKEDFAAALELVRAAPAHAAREPEVLLLNAVLLIHSGQLAQAEAMCRRLLELDELNAGAHYVLALCRESAGDGNGATDHDQVAVHLDPAFAMPRLHLGLLARRAGDREGARRELGQALILLRREDASRLLLFGGGFGRDMLLTLCRSELLACGGRP
jgi:chemotaxis protein methyltransferase CheR